MRVVLVDDHTLVRQGTRVMLEETSQIAVVGELTRGDGLLAALAEKQPDVLLLDLSLGEGASGLELLPEVKRAFPTLKVLLLTAHTAPSYQQHARQLQADGYLVKTVDPETLRRAVLGCVRGETVFCLQEVAPEAAQAKLTPREAEVLLCIAQGMTNAEIAGLLILSVKTVDTHVANLMKKYAVANRAQLAAQAARQGLLGPVAETV